MAGVLKLGLTSESPGGLAETEHWPCTTLWFLTQDVCVGSDNLHF